MRDPELQALIDDLKAIGIPKNATAERAARMTYSVLRKHAKLYGQNPDIECMIRTPGEERHFEDTKCWVVAWEAGPYQWAITASMADGVFPRLVEPYYSFDLTFYPAEWEGRK